MTESEKERLNYEWDDNTERRDEFNITRRVYHQEDLNKDADYHKPSQPLRKQARKVVACCGVGECVKNSVPIVKWLPNYNVKRDLIGDCIAGATTAVMHIPQGMAYGLLTETQPIVGLYMAFFPVLMYVVFGTSPHVSMGTFAVACLMAGKVVNTHATHEILNGTFPAPPHPVIAAGTHYTPMQVLCALTLMIGFIQIAMWVLRLGAISNLLSDPLVSGFTTAAAIHVLSSQIKDIFGLRLRKHSGNFKIVLTVIDICKNIGMINWAAFVISFISCVIIALNNEVLKPWVSKRTRVPIPIELIAVVIGTLVSKYCNLHQNFNISLVGPVPTGLPAPTLPPTSLLGDVAVDAFIIVMVTYTITMSMALIFAAKDKYEIDANQELLALGASNVFGSFFACAPICASLARSTIQYQTGGKTHITQVISALLILCVLLWIGPFFQDLPRCILGSIIIVSLKSMFMQVQHLSKFWRLSKLDAVVWLITFLTTVLVNIDIGLIAGVVASVGCLFIRAQKPYTCLLGRVPDTDLYLDIKRYRAAEELVGIKIFHYCGGLNFATKNLFRSILFRKIGYMKPDSDNDSEHLSRTESYTWNPTLSHKVQCVIIDVTALSYVDAPGVKMLVSIHEELLSNNIHVLLAGANGPVLEMIDKYNKLNSEKLQIDTFPTVHDAVIYYRTHEMHVKEPVITVSTN